MRSLNQNFWNSFNRVQILYLMAIIQKKMKVIIHLHLGLSQLCQQKFKHKLSRFVHSLCIFGSGKIKSCSHYLLCCSLFVNENYPPDFYQRDQPQYFRTKWLCSKVLQISNSLDNHSKDFFHILHHEGRQ